MEKLKLTSEEKSELAKRGFFVVKLAGTEKILSLIISVSLIYPIYLWLSPFIIYPVFSLLLGAMGEDRFMALGDRLIEDIGILGLMAILHLPFILFLFRYLRDYIISGGVFYTSNGIIPTEMFLKRSLFYNYDLDTIKGFLFHPTAYLRYNGSYNKAPIIILVILYCFLWGLTFGIVKIATGYNIFEPYFTYFSIVLIFLIFTGESGRWFIHIFHPLYAFGNLGEKIQKLTPQIESQSKEIQQNFQSDMNFRVLSEGFDSLSSTFSEIVSLVIKLEKVEKRANKGNLFDSEKYINSLRSDIVEPLKSLKSFLEQQREELLDLQKELQRVRIGGRDPETSSGGREQAELSSKRSESLLGELTENIGKLDEMIAKMG